MTTTTLPHPNTYAVPGSRVLAGEYPFAKEDAQGREKLRRFLDAGITYFVDLTTPEDRLTPYKYALHEYAGRYGSPVYTNLPIPDNGVPAHEHMNRILDVIDRAVEGGHTVYVHCWGGVGRTGTVVGCHLVRRGMSGDQALDTVDRLFRTMSRQKVEAHAAWGSPQTRAQKEFVRHWVEPARAPGMPISFKERRDRIRGALVGLAVGDAVGTTVEFRSPGSFAPITDMVGGGPFGLEPGQWTDDTSMALCLAESLIECRRFNARDQMMRYVWWWKSGHNASTDRCFDIGNTTRRALQRFIETGEPFAGSTDQYTAGNGSIMRLAPVAMFYAAHPKLGVAMCGESSKTTHAAAVAVDACRYLGALLLGAFAGATKEELLSPFYAPVEGYWDEHPLVPEIAEIAAGSFKRKEPPAIRGTGYAAESLEAALWAFHTTDDFPEGCLRAVNLGNDADTTAAVYGQIAGAFYGERAIPEAWREKLARRETIDRCATLLAELSAADGIDVTRPDGRSVWPIIHGPGMYSGIAGIEPKRLWILLKNFFEWYGRLPTRLVLPGGLFDGLRHPPTARIARSYMGILWDFLDRVDVIRGDDWHDYIALDDAGNLWHYDGPVPTLAAPAPSGELTEERMAELLRS